MSLSLLDITRSTISTYFDQLCKFLLTKIISENVQLSERIPCNDGRRRR